MYIRVAFLLRRSSKEGVRLFLIINDSGAHEPEQGVQQMSFVPSRQIAGQVTPRPDLTLILPCYNEAKRLKATLDALRETLDSWSFSWEGIIVDDGSIDETTSIALLAGKPFRVISLEHNLGKGGAIRAGMLAARGAVVAFTDADLPFHSDALYHAVHLVLKDEYDAVFGDRNHPMSRVNTRRPYGRQTASLVFQQLQRLILPLRTRDTQCGLKVFRHDVGVSLFRSLESRGFAFDVEIVARAERSGVRLGSVPVVLVRDELSKVSLFRHALPMLAEVFMTRLRLMKRSRLPQPMAERVLKKSA